MTDQTAAPYTDADLRAEAARQHHELTRDPDFVGIGESMELEPIASTACRSTVPVSGPVWGSLLDGDDPEEYGRAQRKIDDLITKAADVSAWAVALGAAGLEPGPTFAWKCHGDHDVAVQVATSPQIVDAKREELAAEIQRAVDATVSRVLGLVPVEGGAL